MAPVLTFADILPKLGGVEGWMTDGQGAMLARYAAQVRDDEAIVEIGSHRGRSTIVLALSRRGDVPLTAVDPFDDPYWGGGADSLEVFESNLERAGVRDQVELFRGFGEQAAAAWSGPRVGLLYLDGAHDFRTVDRELALWRAHLARGARVLCHDTFSSHGVTRAVLRHAVGSRSLAYLGRTGTLAAFELRPLTADGYAATVLGLVAQLPYFARNVVVKVVRRRGWPGVIRLLRHDGVHDPY